MAHIPKLSRLGAERSKDLQDEVTGTCQDTTVA